MKSRLTFLAVLVACAIVGGMIGLLERHNRPRQNTAPEWMKE